MDQSDLTMKYYRKQIARGVGYALLISFALSCNPKNESDTDLNESYEVVQTPTSDADRLSWRDSVNSGNAVRVNLDSARTFDWKAFRQKFHDSSNTIDGDYPEDVAVGPWVNWNEFEYRRVYNYVDDELWIQTFYRSRDSTNAKENKETVLMDSQNPDYVQFGPLWSDMLTRGHHLTDSLK
jgi:hypothetical protein